MTHVCTRDSVAVVSVLGCLSPRTVPCALSPRPPGPPSLSTVRGEARPQLLPFSARLFACYERTVSRSLLGGVRVVSSLGPSLRKPHRVVTHESACSRSLPSLWGDTPGCEVAGSCGKNVY